MDTLVHERLLMLFLGRFEFPPLTAELNKSWIHSTETSTNSGDSG